MDRFRGRALLLITARCFSMAGRLVTAAAAFAVCLLQALTGQRSGRGEWLAILAALTAAMLLAGPMNREARFSSPTQRTSS